ncbi:MAG TPA: manganese efflux pump MntP family protein [Candidatus Limiplasma sp.]|nr:manganese efflux pump MntP family protein [Candidatus Limiplasma sp.]HPS81774.1 manganese efflux pump MntP family protein [Candidatus Limiplasma sp.]
MELVLIAVGLSMDAFAVSLCKGLCMQKLNYRHGAVIALFFGGFQMLMPLLGWVLGKQFERYITPVDHWIAFALLTYIGGKMIWEATHDREEQACDVEPKLDLKELFGLAIATSIDALAVGITFAFLQTPILPAVIEIGAITFLLSFGGVAIGHQFGTKLKRKAEIAGGAVLILIGLKILLEHLGLIV